MIIDQIIKPAPAPYHKAGCTNTVQKIYSDSSALNKKKLWKQKNGQPWDTENNSVSRDIAVRY